MNEEVNRVDDMVESFVVVSINFGNFVLYKTAMKLNPINSKRIPEDVP